MFIYFTTVHIFHNCLFISWTTTCMYVGMWLLLMEIRPEMSETCQRPQVACMHPCYVKEALMSLTLRSCRLLSAPLATILGVYNHLFRTPNIGACFGHTQNSRRCLAIKRSASSTQQILPQQPSKSSCSCPPSREMGCTSLRRNITGQGKQGKVHSK